MENKSYLFILSDDQIRDEKYFDDINIIMSTDDISYIYTAEEKSTILNKMMDLAHEEVTNKFCFPRNQCWSDCLAYF